MRAVQPDDAGRPDDLSRAGLGFFVPLHEAQEFSADANGARRGILSVDILPETPCTIVRRAKLGARGDGPWLGRSARTSLGKSSPALISFPVEIVRIGVVKALLTLIIAVPYLGATHLPPP